MEMGDLLLLFNCKKVKERGLNARVIEVSMVGEIYVGIFPFLFFPECFYSTIYLSKVSPLLPVFIAYWILIYVYISSINVLVFPLFLLSR